MNSIPITTNNLIDVSKGDHWLVNRDSIQGSAITSIVSYNQQFAHFDNFSGMSLPDLQKYMTTEGGVSIAGQTQTWGLSVTNAASQLNYYVFFICQKTLEIRQGDVQVRVEV